MQREPTTYAVSTIDALPLPRRPVIVKLNSGVDYRGVLAHLDGYMNIAVRLTSPLLGL